MPRLFVAISGHGFGHLGQISPLINELCRRRPDLELVLQSELPRAGLASRVQAPFRDIAEATDLGVIMDGPLRVLPDDTVAAYARFHAEWDTLLARQIAHLETERPDLLIADVPYLPLAAAQAAGIPNIGLCSLNWRDVFTRYCGDTPRTRPWLATMQQAYDSADLFLQPAPSMPMHWLENRRPVGPIAALGRNRRDEICLRLGLTSGTRLVLVTLGGIAPRLPMHHWPDIPGVAWLMDRMPAVASAHSHPLSVLEDLPFVDVLTSVDCLITKPGYGAFTEAACNGVPVLYVQRGDWPEEPYLGPWLEANTRALRISQKTLNEGDLKNPLETLWSLPAPENPPTPSGIAEAADLLMPYLK